MSPIVGIIIFLVLFAIIMIAVGLASRFVELQSKKQVATILNPVTAEDETLQTSILMDPEERDPLENLLQRSELPGRLQVLL